MKYTKPIIKQFKKSKLISFFRDGIRCSELADMQLISEFNKRIRFLLCVFDICSKYAWAISLKDKNALQSVMHFKGY